MAAAELFVVLAGVILVGYAANLVARRAHFPDLLVLILLGMALGPLNRHVLHLPRVSAVVDAIPLETVTPVFGAIALAVIMFDAGLTLHPRELATGFRRASLHTVAVFALTMAGIAVAMHAVLGWPLEVGALLGAALGGLSAAVVLSVARQLRLTPKARTMLTLEAVIVDVLAILAATTLILALQGRDLADGAVAWDVGLSLGIGVASGVAAGLGLALALPSLRGLNLYALATGLLLAVYGLAELAGGSGPLGALAFGLLLGNGRSLFRRRDLAAELHDEIRSMHGQMSFLIRTFFFVLLGLQFDPLVLQQAAGLSAGHPWLARWDGTLLLLGLAVASLVFVIFAARALVSLFTAPAPGDRRPLSLMVGRGLGSAVLASFPFTIPAFSDPASAYAEAMGPYRALFITLTSLVVLLTVATNAFAPLLARGRPAAAPAPEAPVDPDGTVRPVFFEEVLEEPGPEPAGGAKDG